MHRARTSDCAGRRTASSYSGWGRLWARAKALAPCSPDVALSASVSSKASVVGPSCASIAEGATNSSTLVVIILSLVYGQSNDATHSRAGRGANSVKRVASPLTSNLSGFVQPAIIVSLRTDRHLAGVVPSHVLQAR